MTDVDLVQVNFTWVIEVGNSSFVVGRDFIDGTGLFAQGECRHGWIRNHPQHTATRAPDWLRQALVPVG